MFDRSTSDHTDRSGDLGAPQSKFEIYANNTGIYAMLIGLVGLLINPFGLRIGRLRHLNPEHWPILVVVVGFGGLLFVCGNHRRRRYALIVSGIAAGLLAILTVENVWFIGFSSANAQAAGSAHSPAGKPYRSDWIDPFELYLGQVLPTTKFLLFEVHGDLTPQEAELVMNWMVDKVPEAKAPAPPTASTASDEPGVAVFAFSIGPVRDTSQLLDQITFAKVTPLAPVTVRLDVRRPLPTVEETMRNRATLLLAELRSNEHLAGVRAAASLKSMKPLALRREISDELLRKITDTPALDSFTYALFVWGTAEQLPDLENIVANGTPKVKEAAQQFINRIKADMGK